MPCWCHFPSHTSFAAAIIITPLCHADAAFAIDDADAYAWCRCRWLPMPMPMPTLRLRHYAIILRCHDALLSVPLLMICHEDIIDAARCQRDIVYCHCASAMLMPCYLFIMAMLMMLITPLLMPFSPLLLPWLLMPVCLCHYYWCHFRCFSPCHDAIITPHYCAMITPLHYYFTLMPLLPTFCSPAPPLLRRHYWCYAMPCYDAADAYDDAMMLMLITITPCRAISAPCRYFMPPLWCLLMMPFSSRYYYICRHYWCHADAIHFDAERYAAIDMLMMMMLFISMLIFDMLCHAIIDDMPLIMPPHYYAAAADARWCLRWCRCWCYSAMIIIFADATPMPHAAIIMMLLTLCHIITRCFH